MGGRLVDVEINSKQIKDLIYTIRGKQVKNNIKKFDDDFRFQLTDEETSQLVANCDRLKTLKYSSSNPYCFTESGIAMLSSVLKSNMAVKVSIRIMTTFVEMRRFLVNNREIFARLSTLLLSSEFLTVGGN